MADVNKLEKQLDDIFVKNAPFQLPENAKKWIVEYLPYINLVLGVFALWSALVLYRWATTANRLVDYANDLARSFGVEEYSKSSRLTLMVWLSIIVLAIQGVLYVVSFSSVKARKKQGWNLLFLAMAAYALYGLVSLFTDYSTFGNLIGYIVGTVVGLYFLFQIRSYYLPAKTPAKSAAAPVAKKK